MRVANITTKYNSNINVKKPSDANYICLRMKLCSPLNCPEVNCYNIEYETDGSKKYMSEWIYRNKCHRNCYCDYIEDILTGALLETNSLIVKIYGYRSTDDEDYLYMSKVILYIVHECAIEDTSGYYTSIRREKQYLYYTDYKYCNYDYAYDYFKNKAGYISPFGCTSVRRGNYYGRNFDWMYSENPTFVVNSRRGNNKYASVGVASYDITIPDSVVASGVYNDAYKVMPFLLLDGVNEHGVLSSINVVPTDYGTNCAVPTSDSRAQISGLMIVKYILDNFSSAEKAVKYIKKHVTVYFPKLLQDGHYELHCMVADEEHTYLLEFLNNQTVVVDMTENVNSPLSGKAYMTNFYLSNIILNDDGTVYTPETQTAERNAVNYNNISPNGCGLERYNLIVQNYQTADTKDGMRRLMNKLKYTKSYPTAPEVSGPFWYTEFVGARNLTAASPSSEYDEILPVVGQMYVDRVRDGETATWQTIHSSVYDIGRRELYLIVQEDGEELKYSLMP